MESIHTETAGGGGFNRRWTNLSLRGKGLVVMALPLAALLFASFSFWLTHQKNQRATDSVARSSIRQTQFRNVLGLVLDAQKGVRGWPITRQDRWVRPITSPSPSSSRSSSL